MTYQLSTLPNGLRVATETLPGMESVTVAVTVDVGARFENTHEGGISHMLEHMAFKGTQRRSARDIAEEMDMVGGNMNAYTSMENTVYYTRVLKNDVPLAVDMLADILQHSVFDKDELERERQVILQEIAMHYDTPDDLVFDHFSSAAFAEQPIGRSILGLPEQVSSYKSDDLMHYMGKHYHASSMVITAAGNINHDAFVKLAGEHFSSISTKPHATAPQGRYTGGDRRTKRKLEQLHFMLGFQGISFLDNDYYTWQLMATILGGGMSSRLFQEVREKRGLAYTVQAFVSSYSDAGLLGIYAATSEDKAADMIPVICAEALRLQQGISEHELQRAKNQIKSGLLMSRESSSAVAEWIGRHILCYGRYRTAAEITTLIDAITADDIMHAGQRLLAHRNITVTTLGPQKKLPDYGAIQAYLAA
ncbi:MAG TPA: pitrilysin family protein [Rickettsiales bacterium]|nr:pitrilysin family protein [Rickettsiales bacterium]